MRRLLSVCFLLSGAAGLIYEVLWVREFGNIFGNTTSTASLVVAVFMGGLGLGGFLAGRWADANYANDPVAPLRMYARVELAIAALGAINAFAIPGLVSVSASFSSYVTDAHGWHELSAGSWAWRYAAALLLLLPVTTLMGATLTLLIRYVVAADVASAGLRIGQLYAINTLGAAAGAVMTDRLLVPMVGLHGSQLFAVLLNLTAGLGASRLAKEPVTAAAPPAPQVENTSTENQRPLYLVGLATLLAGFAAMGLEMVWFRHLSSMLGGYRSVFSLTLAVILLGIVIGAAVGGRLVEKFKQPGELFVIAQGLFVLTTLGALALSQRVPISTQIVEHAQTFLASPAWVKAAWELALEVQPMLLVAGIPALFMGATFPVANACIQRAESVVGRRAGALYLANTVGGVLGSSLAGHVILPALGSQRSVIFLGAVAVAGLVPMFLASPGEKRRVVFGGALATTALALIGWSTLPDDFLIRKSLLHVQAGEAQILTWKESPTELLVVQQRDGLRELYTNGHSMSATGNASQRYMRAFVHVPLLMNPAPENVLVICFGVGNTIHAASLHPSVKNLEIADLSRNILEHASWFESMSNHGVLGDPRTQVFINDGRQHLRMSAPKRYDLITLEPPPISFAGVSSLYSKDFYKLARSRLKPGGAMTQWLPAYQVSAQAVREMVRAFIEIFPGAVLLSGSGRELILYGVVDGRPSIDPAQVKQALLERPLVQADLDAVSLGTMVELVGTYAGSSENLLAASTDAMPLTDDEPTLEYSEVSDVLDTQLPAYLMDNRRVELFCPKCFVNGAPVEGLELLPAYLDLLAQVYAAPSFQETSVFKPNELREPMRIKPPPRAQEAVDASKYLQTALQRGPSRK